MQLGKKGRNDDLLESIKAEEGIPDQPTQPPSQAFSQLSVGGGQPGYSQQQQVRASPHQAAQSPQYQDVKEGMQLLLEEKMTLKANKDGGLTSMEVKGSLMLRVTDPSKASCKIALSLEDDPAIQYMTHPKVDKPSFLSEKVVQLREGSSGGFPVGQALGILKWRYTSKEESKMPLTGEFFMMM